jgi:hypothetical protein
MDLEPSTSYFSPQRSLRGDDGGVSAICHLEYGKKDICILKSHPYPESALTTPFSQPPHLRR